MAKNFRRGGAEARSDVLRKEVNALRYQVSRHNEPWRDAVGKQLNTLLDLADFFAEFYANDDAAEYEADLCEHLSAALNTVRRVAAFEEIRERRPSPTSPLRGNHSGERTHATE